MEVYDTIIIGGGPAGYAAALYAARFKLKTLILTEEKGGRLKLTHIIENYPGVGAVSGPELMDKMESQATQFGCEIKEEKVKGVKKQESQFSITTDKQEYFSKTVIIATGIERRKLNIPGEKEFQNKGVSFCATCDGALFRDRDVAVVGGGDSAAKEALMLTEYAKKVYIIYRGAEIKAEPIIMDSILEKVKQGKIELVLNSNVIEIQGNKMMSHVVLDNPYKNSSELKIDGIFIEIGGIPGSLIAKELGVALDKKEQIIIDSNSKTNIPGIFAAGDVTNSTWKQGIVAASQGSFAAFSAYEFLKTKNTK